MEARNSLLASMAIAILGLAGVFAFDASVLTVVAAMAVTIGTALGAVSLLLWRWQRQDVRDTTIRPATPDTRHDDAAGPTALAG